MRIGSIRSATRTDGHGVDVLLEMSGSAAAIEQGLTVMRNGGRAALLGLPNEKIELDIAELVIFKGAYAARHPWPKDVRDVVSDATHGEK